jgi:hypothetical protein
MATREELLRENVADSRRKIERHLANIAEWEMELRGMGVSVDVPNGGDSLGAGGFALVPPGGDPTSIIREFEYATYSQPEAIRAFLGKFGKPLKTGEIMAGLLKGGVKLGGSDPIKQKNNVSTILTRMEGVVRVGRGAWALGTKKPKSDSEKKPERESKGDTK